MKSRFDEIKNAEQDLLHELELTALALMKQDPIPALVRAFAWVEQRRVARQWNLFEMGLLMVLAEVKAHKALNGLGAEIRGYLEQRDSKWLAEADKPKPPPNPKMMGPEWDEMRGRIGRQVELELKERVPLLASLFEAGEAIEPFPVIAFPTQSGEQVTTVWGFKGKKKQWPSKKEVGQRRRAVRKARSRPAK